MVLKFFWLFRIDFMLKLVLQNKNVAAKMKMNMKNTKKIENPLKGSLMLRFFLWRKMMIKVLINIQKINNMSSKKIKKTINDHFLGWQP